jgi:cyclophilin family peptidyl-prolyl cis-trans isomerase
MNLRGCRLLLLLAACSVLVFGCKPKSSSSPASASAPASTATHPKIPAGAKSSGGKHAVLAMEQGDIEIELLPEAAPKAVENFRLLAEHGLYNGLTFHRVIKDFMIQGGDPEGTGMGGMSAWGGKFEDEIDRNSPLYRTGYKRGIAAMANSGPNTNTSQFFILHADYRLPPAYVIFGRVTKGIEVVDKIVNLPMAMGMDGDMSRPITPVVMKKVTIRP